MTRDDVRDIWRPPSPAIRWAARFGMISLLPYAAFKEYWALGGRVGLPTGFSMADEFRRNGAPDAVIWMERHGIDFTAVLALVGAVLLAALVQPWGARLPRWSVIVPACTGALLLMPYGVLTAAITLTGGGDENAPAISDLLTVAAVVAFCGSGTALAVCAWSYRNRSDSRSAREPIRTASSRSRRASTTSRLGVLRERRGRHDGV